MTHSLSKKTLADLKASGLKRFQIQAMRIRDVGTAELYEIYKEACKRANMTPPKCLQDAYGYEIPYLDFNGNPTGYCRYKLFGEYIPQGAKQPVKYLQMPNTKPKFYFPPFCNWNKITVDTSIQLYFVEGEKKAAALCAVGCPAIGLGGVWSWKSRDNENSEPIADFNLIDFKNRKTAIVFDADV